MSLKHGLIGLLAREGPQTGYQLTKAFDRSVNFFWNALPGQIYPELARLVDAGLIRQTGSGPRGAKRYEATAEGIAELRRWITEDEPTQVIRNETLVRVFFSYLVDPAEAEGFLRRQADAYGSYLVTLEEIAAGPAETLAERASWLTVDAGVRVTRARLEWAESAIDEVRRWGAKRPRGGTAPARNPRNA
jgi:PadR family transcriptional regulator, regulatory protein AphA